MIVSNKGPSEDPSDAPPPYDGMETSSPTRPTFNRLLVDSKRDHSVEDLNLPEVSSPTISSKASSSKKPWFSWFGETSKKDKKEIKQTVQALIRDVVQDPQSAAAAYVLQSCSDTCKARGLSFQSILSEKFIEGHNPIYWAIVKLSNKAGRNDEEENEGAVTLLDILLSVPMDRATRAEAYLACLLTSDQTLFRRLRGEEPNKISAHELLLGVTPEDKLEAIDGDADYGAFRLIWNVAKFQQRMRAIGYISTEVVVRGRLWSISFAVLTAETTSMGAVIKNDDPRSYIQGTSRSLVIPLDKHWNGHSLQFDGCSYLNSDASLKVIVDGSLMPPPSGSDSDCIIS
ncbi:hypothetical protein M422DRAFT_31546 [Sphaerobolus stellatus SS14]|uniref:Uncharacterized protein n=1 Tax=Sphaerobolus stellatus (strain SS14) TaxID=990650 RepID=A0A0C9UFX8_SPHS4|nr:hypothetical protein M422DRAFT_31546 [Sphaerobolus stellatus SS14]